MQFKVGLGFVTITTGGWLTGGKVTTGGAFTTGGIVITGGGATATGGKTGATTGGGTITGGATATGGMTGAMIGGAIGLTIGGAIATGGAVMIGATGFNVGAAIATGGAVTIGAIGFNVGGATATGGAVMTGEIGLGAAITGIVPMEGFGATPVGGVNGTGAGAIKILGLVIGAIVVTGLTGAAEGFNGAPGTLLIGGIGLGCPTVGWIFACGAFWVVDSAPRFLAILFTSPAGVVASSAYTPDTNPTLNPILINTEVILMAHLRS